MSTETLTLGKHTASLAGMDFQYTIVGTGPLLVVQAPGWGIGSTYLRNGLTPLESQFSILTFDPRGSGATRDLAGADLLSNADMIEDLEKLRQFWGMNAIDLIGHSNGGAVAIGYAERYPDRVRRLLLIGTELAGFSGDEATRELDRTRRDDPQFKSAFNQMHSLEPKTDVEFTKHFIATLPYYLYNSTKDLSAMSKTVSNILTLSARAVYIQSPLKAQMPPLAALSRVKAETLIIVGRQDPTCPVVVSQRVHQEVERSELDVYEETGHFPWIEKPQVFFERVSSFFGR